VVGVEAVRPFVVEPMRLRAERVAEYGGAGWFVEVVQVGHDKYARVWPDEYMDRRELGEFARAIGDIVKAMEP
jgi:hypothetical protein